MKERTPLRILVILSALCALALPASAIIVINGYTGLFGITSEQTIRVSVLNLDAASGIVPCTKVIHASGRLLAQIDATSALRRGEGTFLDFDAAALRLGAGERAQVRVELSFLPQQRGQRAVRVDAREVILSLEVIDTQTGKTGFTMPLELKGFNPQPEPPA
jgi:hypothetical protein